MADLTTKVLSPTKRGRWDGRDKPHQLILWLAVLKLIECGHIKENKVHLDAKLRQAFSNIFQDFALGDDLPQIGPPFFHLRSSGIWHHIIKLGQEEYYNSLTTSGGGTKRLEQSVEYVQIDNAVF